MEEQEYKKGQKVRFVRKPLNESFLPHYDLSLEYIEKGKLYTVEHYFYGNPAQVELKGIDSMLFIAEMFDLVEWLWKRLH